MVNNSLQKTDVQKSARAQTFGEFIAREDIKKSIINAVGAKNFQRFATSIISAVTANPDIQECSKQSVLSVGLVGESLDLSPSPQLGHYYFLPFSDKNKGLVAVFVLGYKGYIQLALRSGYYKKIIIETVKKGEFISYNPFEDEIELSPIQDRDLRNLTPTIGYYAKIELNSGMKKVMYWTKNEMIDHADKYSPSFSKDARTTTVKGQKRNKVSFADFEAGNYQKEDAWMYSSFWYKDFDKMAKKTMVRQILSEWGIMSNDMKDAYDYDTAVLNEDGSIAYSGLEVDYKESLPEENLIGNPQASEEFEQVKMDAVKEALKGTN